MNCPNCGASSNNFGVFLGHNNNSCLRCGVDYNYKTGEISFRNLNKPIHSPEELGKLIDLIGKA